MAPDRKRFVIIGATSVIAEHCARLWVAQSTEGIDLTLVGRNAAKIERVAADLRVRSPLSIVRTLTADFNSPSAIHQVVDDIVSLGQLHTVLIAHGSLPDQEQCQQDIHDCHAALHLNGISPVLFAEAFAAHMQAAGCGTLALIGSVAGDRGRKSNYIYGAAKGLVARYAQGLQHRFAKTAIKVVLIKPGPTDTPMTAHLKEGGARLAKVEDVAKIIVAGIGQGKPVIYAPGKWELIMMVIRHLPNFIFNQLNI